MLKKKSNSPILNTAGEETSSEFFQNLIGEKWVDTKYASNLLGITENALRIMVCRRQVAAYKLGRRLRFRPEDLAKLLLKKE